jgi:hypothetical protein
MDVRVRELERGLAQGNVEAAEQLLWYFARINRWFMSPEWKPPGGSPPYPSQVNDRRAYLIRLLGYLKWGGARELQEVVAGQAPERRELPHWPGHYESSPAQVLGQTKPFSRIGPETAQDLGAEVTQALAAAAVRKSFPSTDLDRSVLVAAMEFVLLHSAVEKAWRSRAINYEEFRIKAKPLEDELWRLKSSVLPSEPRRGFREPGELARYHSREALSRFLGAIHRHSTDQPENYAEVIFHAVYALAFACEEEKGGGTTQSPASRRSPWSSFRSRIGWGDDYGLRPGRACAAKANREIKRAMIAPALLAVASELVSTSA